MEFKDLSDKELFELTSLNFEAELEKRGYTHGWFKPNDYAGEIYILVNPAFPNLVKIGYADNTEKRMRILNRSSGIPDPFHCYATYKVKKRLEDLKLHSLIDVLDPSLRHTKNREFYEMSKEKAYGILSAIAQINGDEDLLKINPYDDDFFDDDDVKWANESGENGRKLPRGRLTFEMLGIPVGSTLTFKEDESVTVKTADTKNKVMFDGKIYPISKATKEIKEKLGTANKSGAYQGGIYFKYNGELLTDMRDRIEQSE